MLYSECVSPEDRAAAMILYHAAIAAAFGSWNAQISGRRTSAFKSHYEDLAAALGDDSLGDVFRRAAKNRGKRS